MTSRDVETSSTVDHHPLSMTWNEIDQAVELLAEQLSGQTFDVVAGIVRSGLVPAVILAHKFAIRDFAVLDIRRTESDAINASKRLPAIAGVFNEEALVRRRVLLVDDIVGEGLTMKAARAWIAERSASVTTCCLVVNKANLRDDDIASTVDHCGCVVHRWVAFPWENHRRD